MNEDSKCWCLVRRQGGSPDNWFHLTVDGARAFTGVKARELLAAYPGLEMLHYPGYYAPNSHVGNPDHPAWGNTSPPHPAWSPERLAAWNADREAARAEIEDARAKPKS